MNFGDNIGRETDPEIIIDKPRKPILEAVYAMNLIMVSGGHHDTANDVVQTRTETSARKNTNRRYRRLKKYVPPRASQFHRGKGTVLLDGPTDLGEVMTHEDTVAILHKRHRPSLLIAKSDKGRGDMTFAKGFY
jgi:hypothetical protein